MSAEVSIEDLTRALERAHERSEALLTALRTLQIAAPPHSEGTSAELKESLTNLIIMRTRLNERQSALPELMREVSEQGLLTSVLLPDDVAERMGLT